MKIIKGFKWCATWLSLTVLKRALHYRINADGGYWLQPIAANTPLLFNRIDFIFDHCRGKNVLHIGFTDHPYTRQRIKDGLLLHNQLRPFVKGLTGMDVEDVAVQQYITLTKDKNVFKGDIMIGYPPQVLACKPALILLPEVLEHLTNPYKAIEVLHTNFAAGTMVLVTVPNYTALDCWAASLNNAESIHPNHHWYFSPYTLRRLFDEKRFKMEQLHFGMYNQTGYPVNPVLKKFPFNGDCILALFTIIKDGQHD